MTRRIFQTSLCEKSCLDSKVHSADSLLERNCTLNDNRRQKFLPYFCDTLLEKDKKQNKTKKPFIHNLILNEPEQLQ